jgi:hypothetical protein
MAVFVDLGEEDNDPPQDGQPVWHGPVDAVKPVPVTAASSGFPVEDGAGSTSNAAGKQPEEAHGLAVGENLNRNSMTQALGCYP